MASVVTDSIRNHPCCLICFLVNLMKFNLKIGFKIGLTVFLTYIAITYSSMITDLLATFISALKPLMVGAFIAFVVNIPMSFYEKIYFPKRLSSKIVTATKRPVCMILAYLSIIIVIYFMLAMVIPELIRCGAQLMSKIPQLYNSIASSEFVTEWIPTHIPYLVENFDFGSVDIREIVTKSLQVIGDSIGGVFNFSFTLLASVFSTLVTAVVSIIFSVYLLIGKNKLAAQIKRISSVVLKPSVKDVILHVAEVISDSFRKFFVGQFTEAIILGVLCTVGMLIFRFPYASMIGVLIGFTALIPVAGAYIGAILGAVMIMTESSFVTALLFVVFIVVLQQLEGNIIYPKVVGNSVGLPALWVLVAVTVGGVLGGIFGMLVAVPIFASAYKLSKEYVKSKEEQ